MNMRKKLSLQGLVSMSLFEPAILPRATLTVNNYNLLRVLLFVLD